MDRRARHQGRSSTRRSTPATSTAISGSRRPQRPAARPTFTFTPRSSTGETSIKDTLAAALSTVLLREQLAHRGIVAAEANTMLQPVDIVAAKGSTHEDHESAESQRRRALLPHVPGHHALRHECRPLHHRGENLAHLRGHARHHSPRGHDGRQDPRRRLGRPHPGRHLARRRPAPLRPLPRPAPGRRRHPPRPHRPADHLLLRLLHPRLPLLLLHRRRASAP